MADDLKLTNQTVLRISYLCEWEGMAVCFRVPRRPWWFVERNKRWSSGRFPKISSYLIKINIGKRIRTQAPVQTDLT